MTIIDVRYQLNKILGYDKMYSNNFKECEKLLKVLEDAGDSRYLFYKARFLQKIREFDKAKECYLELTNSDTEQFLAYYGLYTLAVSKKKYEDAYKYILLCKKNSSNSNMDLSFHIALTKACYDLSINPDEFYNENLKVVLDKKKQSSNHNLTRLYEEAAESFNRHDFVTTVSLLQKIRDADHSVNFSFEIDPLLNGIDNLLELERVKYIEFVRKNGIDAELKNGKIDVKTLLNYMQMSIFSNLSLVEKVFYDNYDYIAQSTSEIAFDYLQKRLIEKRKFENLTGEEFENYKKCMLEVKKSMSMQDFPRAIEYANLGKELTGFSVFDYYVGQSYFRIGDNFKAIEKFREYLDNGGIKALKARGYLAFAYTNIGDYKSASLMQEEIAQLKRFYVKIGKNKVYTGPIFKENRDKSGEKKLTATGISESVDKFVDEDLAVGDFCSYSFPQKMALIRKLYLTNMVKVADKLMKEVEKESGSSVEKQFINKERQNKKLYITKGKLGQH